VSEDALGRADQLRTTRLLSSQANNDGSGVSQADLPGNGRPATEGRALQVKEQKDAAKEAFNGTAFAEFLFGPGGWQAGAVLLALGVPGDDRDRMKGGVDPSDEAQAPIRSVQTDDARVDLIETHRPFEQWASEGGIMDVGRREEKKDGQPGAAAEQGMDAIAA